MVKASEVFLASTGVAIVPPDDGLSNIPKGIVQIKRDQLEVFCFISLWVFQVADAQFLFGIRAVRRKRSGVGFVVNLSQIIKVLKSASWRCRQANSLNRASRRTIPACEAYVCQHMVIIIAKLLGGNAFQAI